jgi:hypothetical protein
MAYLGKRWLRQGSNFDYHMAKAAGRPRNRLFVDQSDTTHYTDRSLKKIRVRLCRLTFELTPTAEVGAVSRDGDDSTTGAGPAYSACRSGSGVERGVRRHLGRRAYPSQANIQESLDLPGSGPDRKQVHLAMLPLNPSLPVLDPMRTARPSSLPQLKVSMRCHMPELVPTR